MLTPDKWIIVGTGDVKKVFSSFYGGFLNGDSWSLSSGTKEIIDKGPYWELPQESGSIYKLFKGSYGLSAYAAGVLAEFKKEQPDLKILNIKDGEFIDETTEN